MAGKREVDRGAQKRADVARRPAVSGARPAAAIGFRVKTGRATAVMLAGPAESPHILERRSVQLWDPAVPESHQPYHAALELPEKEGEAVVERACDAVRTLAIRAVRELAKALRDRGHDLRAVALVVGSDTDASKIANPHVRAHALEGRLFRDVLEAGAKAIGSPCIVVVEREAFDKGAAALGRRPDTLKRIVTQLGRGTVKPWGAEEKTATLAAWMALAR